MEPETVLFYFIERQNRRITEVTDYPLSTGPLSLSENSVTRHVARISVLCEAIYVVAVPFLTFDNSQHHYARQ